ncbi:matrixin family metalloprotease [Burkholderia gladioli]|uniref:matrixin family metalloprotease n=1 Tax=Burkholderia gladioli TaxID=28095 RepID=UPI0034DB5F64
MSLIDEVGYSAASVDGIASVQEAEEALNKNPTDPKAQYNYLAAYDNAIAAETAIIPVTGAVFASMAIKADVQNIFYSGVNASTMIPLLSNIAILATQGVALLDGGEVVVAAGGVAFTLDELTAYAGNYLTALGVNVDAGTIQNYMEQSVAQLGLSPNSDESYPINVGSNSTFSFEADGTVDLSFSSDASPAGTTSQILVPTLDSSGNIIGFVATTPVEVYPNGGGYRFGDDNAPSVSTDADTLKDVPNSPAGATPTGLWFMPGSDGSYRNLIQYSDGTYGTLTSTASGASVVNMKNISAPPPGQSNQVITTDNNGQLSSEISGSGAIDNINGASVTIDGGATATVVGSNNTVSSPLAGSAFTLEGTDNQVDASGSTILLAQNSLSDEVVGNQDVVTDVTGSSFEGGSSFGLFGQGNVANVNNDTVHGQDNSSFSIAGSGNSITNGNDSATYVSGNDNYLGSIGGNSAVSINGQGNSVSGSGITVNGSDGAAFSVWGTGNSVTNGSSSATYIEGNDNYLGSIGGNSAVSINGQGNSVSGSDITVNGSDNASFSVWGNSNIVTNGGSSATYIEGNDNYLGSIGGYSAVSINGQGNSVSGSDVTVNGTDNASFSVWGNSNIVTNGAGSATYNEGNDNYLGSIGGNSAVDINGQGNSVSGSDITVNGSDDASFSVWGNRNSITDGNDSSTYIYGNSDVLSYAGTGSYVGVTGQDDDINANGDKIDFTGYTTGDIVEGTDDTGTGWSGVDYINQGSYGYGYGYFGEYGFSGDRSTITNKLASDIAAIAQFDQSQGNTVAATAAQHGFAQAAEMSQDAQTSAGSGPNVLEGARWDAPTITWSFSGASDPQEAQYESSIEQAFSTWAAASGLQFQEVSSSASTDISINWADLNTASTGEVGYTTFKAAHGVIASGASINLESTDQDAMTSSADGGQIYAGTDATFYQTVLHEIGHALGLADNADSGSVMNYDLTSGNRTLDQTDIDAIQALYGSSAQTAALIQAMAGGRAGSAGATATPVEQASMQTQLLAGAH